MKFAKHCFAGWAFALSVLPAISYSDDKGLPSNTDAELIQSFNILSIELERLTGDAYSFEQLRPLFLATRELSISGYSYWERKGKDGDWGEIQAVLIPSMQKALQQFSRNLDDKKNQQAFEMSKDFIRRITDPSLTQKRYSSGKR